MHRHHHNGTYVYITRGLGKGETKFGTVFNQIMTGTK